MIFINLFITAILENLMRALEILQELVATPGPEKGRKWVSDEGIVFEMIEKHYVRVEYPSGNIREYKITQHYPMMKENHQ
jgi:hypothetical protein